MKMVKFGLTNVRMVVSILLISIIACLTSFSVLLRHINTTSAALKEEMTTLHKSFEDGLPAVSILSSSSTSSSLQLQRLQQEISPIDNVKEPKCISTSSNTNSVTYRFQPSTKYKQSTTLPQWMKDYFDWHRKQMRRLNECNYKRYKFIVLRCSKNERKCGGVADRLKALPFFIAAAANSNRIFMIRWERPTKLEEFLIPNEINWSMPDWMYEKTNSFNTDTIFMPTGKHFVGGLKKYKSTTVLEGLIQDFYGSSRYYEKLDCEMDKNKEFDHEVEKKLNDMHGWSSYELIFRDLFNTLFLPAPPVAKLIKEKMESTNLIPGEYTTTQYRAFYAIENKKHTRTDLDLISKTKNAINCASRNVPGAPIFFASDSHTAVIYARKYGEAFNRTVVTFDDEKEALHLDKKDQWKSGNVADFYPTFIDLLIMAEAKCMSYGVGGFGRFASILQIDPKCVVRHDSERIKQIAICKWYDKGDDTVAGDGSVKW